MRPARFNVDPGLDRGGSWLGRPKGASSLTNLTGSDQMTLKMMVEGLDLTNRVSVSCSCFSRVVSYFYPVSYRVLVFYKN